MTTEEADTKPLPMHYTHEMGDLICDQLLDGKSLREICAAPNMPGRATVFRWLRRHPEFREKYAISKSLQLDDLEEEEEYITRQALYHPPTFEGEDAEKKRREWARLLQLRVSALCRKAAWLRAKKYRRQAFVEAPSDPWREGD
jgi:hypothetical protein